MLKRLFLPTASALLVLSLVAGALPTPVQSTASAPAKPGAGTPSRSSLLFVENAGQFAAGARFFAPTGPSGAALWLAGDALWLTLFEAAPALSALEATVPGRPPAARLQPRRGVHLRLSFVGANPRPQIEPFDRLDTVLSYLIGDDPAAWRTAVPVWGGVRYRDLYPGIDLELRGASGQYSPRLLARAGADLGRVRLRVEGAQSLALRDGRLSIQTAVGPFSLPLFQLEGSGLPVGSRGLVHPRVEGLDVVSPLSLDAPVAAMAPQYLGDLRYSTFLGGNSGDYGEALATDSTGSLYVAGYTWSEDFPTTPGAYDTVYGLTDPQNAFLVKLDPTGSHLDYATFLGGSGSDAAWDLAVDATGHAYLTGDTQSADFPTKAGAWDGTFDGYSDAFVVKVKPDGTDLIYSTLLGGAQDDDTGLYNEGGLALVLDGDGQAYVGGWTAARDFPVTEGVLQGLFGGDKVGGDAFLTKLNADGSDLVYSTFLGGSAEDGIESIALDDAGAVYATGRTASADFPIKPDPGAFDPSHNGGRWDAFVAKANSTATALEYSTFVGGSQSDGASAIALGASGDAYITGGTNSPNFPVTPGAYDPDLGAEGSDGFVLRLNSTGTDLVYATFLGGSKSDGGGYAIDVSAAGQATIGGSTASADFPTTPRAFSTIRNGLNDAFVTQLEADGTDLTYSTLLGGKLGEAVTDLVLTGETLANLTGYTNSDDFLTTPGARQRDFAGFQDAFAAKMRLVSYPTVFLPVVFRNH